MISSAEILDKLAKHLHVTWVYAEESAPEGEALTSADLAAMPEPWRQAMAQAAGIADAEQQLELIAEIPPDQAPLVAFVRTRPIDISHGIIMIPV